MNDKILVSLILAMAMFVAPKSFGNHKGPIKIAIIDTGMGFSDKGADAKLCQYGHKDFTDEQVFSDIYKTKISVPKDTLGHGTNITGIIDYFAKKSGLDYCLVIIKFYSKEKGDSYNGRTSEKAIQYAVNLNVDIINLSGGGTSSSIIEKRAIESFLNNGGTFVSAAGNNKTNLDLKGESFYPAMYDSRIVSVGNINRDGSINSSSNFGEKVKRWEIGENVSVYGITLTGTSQATAVATGKLIKELYKGCDRKNGDEYFTGQQGY